jgi:hypothetical protein
VSITVALPVPEEAAGPGWLIAAAYENFEGEAKEGSVDAEGYLHGRVLAPTIVVDLPE